MLKKRKVLISVLAAVLVPVLLLMGGGVATVMADELPSPPEAEANGLLARVAQILDIPQGDLVDAFEQSRQEMREEARTRSLDRALENERITQQEYDAIMEWREQRPDVLDCPIPDAFGASALGGRHMWTAHNAWAAKAWGRLGIPRLAD